MSGYCVRIEKQLRLIHVLTYQSIYLVRYRLFKGVSQVLLWESFSSWHNNEHEQDTQICYMIQAGDESEWTLTSGQADCWNQVTQGSFRQVSFRNKIWPPPPQWEWWPNKTTIWAHLNQNLGTAINGQLAWSMETWCQSYSVHFSIYGGVIWLSIIIVKVARTNFLFNID